METIKNLNSDNMNIVDNNKNGNGMKRLNLLFIEGNRQKIDKTNVKEAYLKIKEYGFIKSMALEYVPMDKAKSKIGNKALFKATVIRKTGEGEPTISNFDIRTETVKPEEYDNYDGVCVDGQHRTLALLLVTYRMRKSLMQKLKYLKTWIFLLMSQYAIMESRGKTMTSPIQELLLTTKR